MKRQTVSKSTFIELLNKQLRTHPKYQPGMTEFQPQNGGMGYIWPNDRATYMTYVEVAGEVHALYTMDK